MYTVLRYGVPSHAYPWLRRRRRGDIPEGAIAVTVIGTEPYLVDEHLLKTIKPRQDVSLVARLVPSVGMLQGPKETRLRFFFGCDSGLPLTREN